MTVLVGLDQIAKHNLLAQKRVGLITTAAALDQNYNSSVAVLRERSQLMALFAPEHGLYGSARDAVPIVDSIDPYWQLPVHSLYGEQLQPAQDTLAELDALVYDIPDIGVRFYTYINTMAYAMEACATAGIQFVVLDRPNPLGGEVIEGNQPDLAFRSFVGRFRLPVRYGLTTGELAAYLNATYHFNCDLKVVPLTGWQRSMYEDDLGRVFINPSPNISSFQTALVYPGTCLLEGTNVSEGRGTTRPFEYCGAPWINPYHLLEALEALQLPGVVFRPIWFTPTLGEYRNHHCAGVHIIPIEKSNFRPFELGIKLLDTLQLLYPKQFRWTDYAELPNTIYIDYLLGTDHYRKAEKSDVFLNESSHYCQQFRSEIAPYLRY